jgi:hypothetical protein
LDLGLGDGDGEILGVGRLVAVLCCAVRSGGKGGMAWRRWIGRKVSRVYVCVRGEGLRGGGREGGTAFTFTRTFTSTSTSVDADAADMQATRAPVPRRAVPYALVRPTDAQRSAVQCCLPTCLPASLPACALSWRRTAAWRGVAWRRVENQGKKESLLAPPRSRRPSRTKWK